MKDRDKGFLRSFLALALVVGVGGSKPLDTLSAKRSAAALGGGSNSSAEVYNASSLNPAVKGAMVGAQVGGVRTVKPNPAVKGAMVGAQVGGVTGR